MQRELGLSRLGNFKLTHYPNLPFLDKLARQLWEIDENPIRAAAV